MRHNHWHSRSGCRYQASPCPLPCRCTCEPELRNLHTALLLRLTSWCSVIMLCWLAAQFDGKGRLWALGRACSGERTVLKLAIAQQGPSGQVLIWAPMMLGALSRHMEHALGVRPACRCSKCCDRTHSSLRMYRALQTPERAQCQRSCGWL